MSQEKLIEIKAQPRSYETYRKVLHGKSLLDVDQTAIVQQRDGFLKHAVSMRPDSVGVENIGDVAIRLKGFRHDFLAIHVPGLNPEQIHLGHELRDSIIDLRRKNKHVLVLRPAPEVVVSLQSQQIYEQLMMADVKMLERKYGDKDFIFKFLDALVELL